jgi:hypothetical protein
VDTARAETYLRLLAEAELRRSSASPGSGPYPHRVLLAATTLLAAGVIDLDVAWRAVGDFEAAARLRSADGDHVLGGVRRPWTASLPRAPAWTAASATMRAVPACSTLRLPPEREGWYGELRLIALVMTDSQTSLTAAIRWAGQTRRSARPRPGRAPLHVVGALDDRGNSYHASPWDLGIEGDGRGWWDCHLRLSPAPDPATRWLDIGPGAGGGYARIDLTALPTPAEMTVEPEPEPASGPARLLENAGDDLLGQGPSAVAAGETSGSRIIRMLGDLTGSGAVEPDDPAVLRLVTVARWVGLDLGTPSGTAAGGRLPEVWTSLLADGDARDGPEGIAAFARVLPEIDGVSLALAGLRSSPERVSLHVMASGWEARGDGGLVRGQGAHDDPLDPALSWRARDDAGRWHLVRGVHRGDRHGMLQLHLTPPLHPAATSLEVIVTGASSRVRATVPLDWRAAS